jgi:hypothetical protein
MMFVKMFRSLLEGTLHSDPETRHVWMDLLLLADRHGEIDMTVSAISGVTGVEASRIEAAIVKLTAPDPASRSMTEDGRRLVPLVEGRGWGWRVVNYEVYRAIRDPESRREQVREATSRWRERQQLVIGGDQGDHDVSRGDPMQRQRQRQRQREEEDVDGEAVSNLPAIRLRNGKAWRPSEALLEEYRRAFPLVDVKAAFERIARWSLDRPTRRKTPRGIVRHVTDWLANDQKEAEASKRRGGRGSSDAAYLEANLAGGGSRG